MQTVIIDYGAGNLHSAHKAFERAALRLEHKPTICVTDSPEKILQADHVVLPGVGSFSGCKTGFLSHNGLLEALEMRVIQQGYPFLGICVGMQLMATEGRELGVHQGFDWIGGTVDKITPSDPTLKIPHMGWNEVRFEPHPVLQNLPDDHAYFVHSYHFTPKEKAHCLAQTEYSGQVTAAVGRDNLLGTQFHPEKSQMLGLSLIENFLRWKP